MKSTLNWMLVILTILVIGFCCFFFFYAFNKTMKQCDNNVPLVQVSIANDCTSNAVFQVLSHETINEKVEAVLMAREPIVEREHNRFRAELATWLSIFGLLTILVSLIAPICSLVFQQKEFDRLQKLIDDQSKSIEDIKIWRMEIEHTAKQVASAKQEMDNEKASSDADRKEEEQRESPNPHDDLRSLLRHFKEIWGVDKFDEKIVAGISFFVECNARITNAIANSDYDSLRNCLNIVNNANAYLGGKSVADFRLVFSEQMQQKRPLKMANDVVRKALKDGKIEGPIEGFYNSALNLQGGMPGSHQCEC